MTKTVEEAFSPLLIIGSFCGLGFFEYPLGRPRPYFSCFYFLITWSFYVYFLYYILTTINILFVFLSWTNIIITNGAVVSMFVSLFRFKELKTCLYKLSIVDDTLEVLGIPKEYQRLYKMTIKVTVGWIVMACVMDMVDIMWMGYDSYFDIVHICVPFVVNHLLHVSTLNGLIWGTILRYTASRFQRLNEYIYNLLENNAKLENDAREGNMLILIGQRRIGVEERRQRMWTIMHVHLQLSRISRELNKVFSIQMTLEMAILFTFLVELFLEFYDVYTNEELNTFYQIGQSLLLYTWATVYTVKLVGLNYTCQIISDKAKETIGILYKLINESSDESLHEQTLQFILQIKQKEVKFSGMGLFYFGYTFIHKFFTSILTVLVIIIQMRMSNTHASNESPPGNKETNA